MSFIQSISPRVEETVSGAKQSKQYWRVAAGGGQGGGDVESSETLLWTALFESNVHSSSLSR